MPSERVTEASSLTSNSGKVSATRLISCKPVRWPSQTSKKIWLLASLAHWSWLHTWDTNAHHASPLRSGGHYQSCEQHSFSRHHSQLHPCCWRACPLIFAIWLRPWWCGHVICCQWIMPQVLIIRHYNARCWAFSSTSHFCLQRAVSVGVNAEGGLYVPLLGCPSHSGPLAD